MYDITREINIIAKQGRLLQSTQKQRSKKQKSCRKL